MGELAGLREYSSSCHCLNEIPVRVRRGLSLVEVQFTCIDAVEEFVAVGTNIGIVYWCNRKTNKIERLRPEKWDSSITSVKVVSSVDYMVAAGDSVGKISIFIIPKEKPTFLLADHEKEKPAIERFTASDIHQSPITAIEWSTNGQKLFTGDERGLIAYTQMDFNLNITKSMEILNEKFRIVQLSYLQPHVLVVASEYRCIVYNQQRDPKIYQVGQKDRISLCKLGAVIGSHSSLSGPVIFSARPKQHIWLADTTGHVHQTLLFKEALSSNYPEIEVLNPYDVVDDTPQRSSRNSSVDSFGENVSPEVEFNCLRMYRGKYLLTYGASSFIILNVEKASVEAALTTRRIVCVAVNKDEIFVLESQRRVRRLAFSGDPYSSTSYVNMSEVPIADTLIGMFQKIRNEASANVVQPLIENLKAVETLPGSKVLSSPAEDALLFFENRHTPKPTDLRDSEEADLTSYDDEIVYREKKKPLVNEKAKRKHADVQTKLLSTESDIPTVTPSELTMVVGGSSDVVNTESSDKVPTDDGVREGQSSMSKTSGFCIDNLEENCRTENDTEYSNSQSFQDIINQYRESDRTLTFSEVPPDIRPDLRTPNTVNENILLNEAILSWQLNQEHEVTPVNASSVPAELPGPLITISGFMSQSDSHSSPSVNPSERVTESETSISTLSSTESALLEPVFEPEESPLPEPVYEPEQFPLPKLMFEPEQFQPLSAVQNPELDSRCRDILKSAEDKLSCSDAALVHSCSDSFWKQVNVPFLPRWIAVTDVDVSCGADRLKVYRSQSKRPQLLWTEQSYRTLKMAVSQSGSILWRLDLGVAYVHITENNSSQWKVMARNVESIAVSETSAWYVCEGLVHVQTNLTPEKPFSDQSIRIDCSFAASKLSCFGNALWVLTAEGHIWNREQLTDNDSLGTKWRKLPYPDTIAVADIVLTCRNAGWIIDKFNNVYFTDNYNSENPDWWQVIIGRCIYKSDASLSDQLSRFVHWSKDRPAAIGSDQSSIWVSLGGDDSVYINRTAVLGHRWTPLSVDGLTLKTKWKFIATADIADDFANVWCLNCNNDLFLYLPASNINRAIQAPPTNDNYDIVSLTAIPGALWMLTNAGKIFMRTGISEQTPFGCSWEELNLNTAKVTMPTFKLLSLGLNVVWALSANDEVYAAVCHSKETDFDLIQLDWRLIEKLASSNTKFIDIIAGPNEFMVWALDSKYNVYVREGIFDDLPFGVGWVSVPGIRAVSLTISSFAVWALTTEGFIYRRSGISSKNYIGDYWAQIPGSFAMISASVSENLWGVSKVTGLIQMYENHVLSLNEDFMKNRKFSENPEDDWEFVES